MCCRTQQQGVEFVLHGHKQWEANSSQMVSGRQLSAALGRARKSAPAPLTCQGLNDHLFSMFHVLKAVVPNPFSASTHS